MNWFNSKSTEAAQKSDQFEVEVALAPCAVYGARYHRNAVAGPDGGDPLRPKAVRAAGLNSALVATDKEVDQALSLTVVQEAENRNDTEKRLKARGEEQKAEFSETLRNYRQTFQPMTAPPIFPEGNLHLGQRSRTSFYFIFIFFVRFQRAPDIPRRNA